MFGNLVKFDFSTDKRSYIESIKTGSSNDNLVIIIGQEDEKEFYCFLLWDLKNMKEINGSDQKKGCKILWDYKG